MTNERGVSLIEVLIALGLLSFAVIFSMSATDQISSTSATSREMSKAQNISVELMEELMAVYDSDVKLTNGTHTQGYDRNGLPVAGAGYYTASWEVQTDTPITKISDIRLTISWMEGTFRRTIQLRTFRGS